MAFRLLREAAEAAAIAWSGPLYPQAAERARCRLSRSLGDLSALCAELAAADGRPELRQFSRCLDAARRCTEALPAVAGSEPGGISGEHGDVLYAAACHVAVVRGQQAPTSPMAEAVITELIGAVQAQASAAGELAGGAGEPARLQLENVRSCLSAAAGYLRAARLHRPPPQVTG